MTKRRVCVIGAGASGIAAIKNLKEYGFEVVCYEARNNKVGGLWNFSDDDSYVTVMRKTILNTSKEFNTFSDFPMSDDGLANFLPNYEIQKYFEAYADHFQLKAHIEFNTIVKRIEKSPSYEKDGSWIVVISRKGEAEEKVEVFSHVMVCTGHHASAHIPPYKGIEYFKGNVYHSQHYKNPQRFFDKRVLIVGLGNSGGDIACELARNAKEVFVCCRNGTWVTRRIVKEGYPRDVTRSRFLEHIQQRSPIFLKKFFTLRDYNNFFNHSNYGLRPKELPGQSPVLLADDLPLHLSSGYIKVRKGIECFTAEEVIFENGVKENIDDVIFCTGFNFDFNFIRDGEKALIEVDDNQVDLYLRIFSPKDHHNTLAIIGLVDPMGPTTTVSEMQSRMCAHVWANEIDLPSKKIMIQKIREQKERTHQMFVCSARKSSLQVPFISYMDELADIIGCKPSVQFKSDPQLASMLYFGPVTPAHYRVTGPHAWKEARSFILGTFKRVHRGMNALSDEAPSGLPSFEIIFGQPLVATVLLYVALGIMCLVLTCLYPNPALFIISTCFIISLINRI